MTVRRSSDVAARCRRVKQALDFGDVAAALGLGGSSRHGWDCPVCCTETTVQERRRDRQGGRCTVCGKGYDILGLVMAAEGCEFLAGLERLETILDERDAAGAPPADLFGGGS